MSRNYYKKNYKSNSNRRNKPEIEFENRPDTPFTTKEDIQKDNIEKSYLLAQTYRDLSKSQPITIYQDPSTATKYSGPYFLLNKVEKMYSAKYDGDRNYAGNSLDMLINDETSGLYSIIDCARSLIYMNYLYANIDGSLENEANNLRLGMSIDQALATTEGQMFRDLPLFSRIITSPSETSAITGKVYTSMPTVDTNGYGIYMIWVQTILQNVAMIGSNFNKFVSMKNFFKKVMYNRGASTVVDFFSQICKSTFTSLIDSVTSCLYGEYFDVDWYNQVKTLTQLPSKKSMSMSDPLLSIVPVLKIPSIKMTDSNGVTLIDNDTMNVEYTYYTDYGADTRATNIVCFQDAIEKVFMLFDPVNFITWARRLHAGTVDSISEPQTVKQYYNAIVWLLEGIQTTINQNLSKCTNDLRVVLPVAERAGLNNWQTGTCVNVILNTEYEPSYNKLVEDFFKSYLASSGKLMFNSSTMRWKFYTMWDQTYGINNFDNFSGGAFLTMSTRGFEYTPGESKTVPKYLLPILFDPSAAKVDTIASDQNGRRMILGYQEYNSSQIAQNKIFNRLNPLSFSDLIVRVPKIEATASITASDISNTYRFLANLFGIGQVGIDPNDNTAFDYCLSSSSLVYIDLEISSIVNQMIVYYQTHSPFRVYTKGGKTIGFIN